MLREKKKPTHTQTTFFILIGKLRPDGPRLQTHTTLQLDNSARVQDTSSLQTCTWVARRSSAPLSFATGSVLPLVSSDWGRVLASHWSLLRRMPRSPEPRQFAGQTLPTCRLRTPRRRSRYCGHRKSGADSRGPRPLSHGRRRGLTPRLVPTGLPAAAGSSSPPSPPLWAPSASALRLVTAPRPSPACGAPHPRPCASETVQPPGSG